jgi:hypothetical protein
MNRIDLIVDRIRKISGSVQYFSRVISHIATFFSNFPKPSDKTE